MRKTILNIVFGVISGIGIGVAISKKYSTRAENIKDKKIYKFKKYYCILIEWLRIKQERKSLEKYFIDNNYLCIAIYGMGEIGNRLYYELKDSHIKVKYAIDKEAGFVDDDLEIRNTNDELDGIDAIVVTAAFAFDEIVDDIKNKVSCPIISLEDIIYEMG